MSPDDRHSEIVRKLDDYGDWGVQDIWLIDPALRRLCLYGADGLTQVPLFALAELGVTPHIEDLV